ncbi:MAG: tetratricopeptide repeat protein [Phormidesmis sp. RL_2_1]|nr:tetratricopeptide repeat protein [Phormidesmis sp. RL_2_1]
MIFQAMNRPAQEAHLLVNIGQAQMGNGQTDAAIASFQQAVNLSETLRQQQSRATELSAHIEAAYRNLATLLIQQNRNDEAQQILNLI